MPPSPSASVTNKPLSGSKEKNLGVTKNGSAQVEKVRERDPCFSQIDRPFGLDEHIFNRIFVPLTHVLGGYMLYLFVIQGYPARTWLFESVYGYIGGVGITAGAHRYWCHKTYKAKKPLQILLMIMQTIAVEYPIFKWALEHRIHHKYTDTDADPHNSKRGFWWSHWIWIFYPKHPKLQEKWKTFDMSDLENDPVVRFQSQYYWQLVFFWHLVFPMSVVMYLFQVSPFIALCSTCLRYCCSLHFTWSVNSVAHKFGDRPYDKNIRPTDNIIVSVLANGEGWHNYHHAFPWDYKAAEFGWKVNLSTMFIDFWAMMGQAYDLKIVSKEVLKARVKRTGDGSHWRSKITNEGLNDSNGNYNDDNGNNAKSRVNNGYIDVDELRNSMEHPSWGWDDKAMPDDWRKLTTVLKAEKAS